MDSLSGFEVSPPDESGQPVLSNTFGKQTTGKQPPDPAGMSHLEVAGEQVKSQKSLTGIIAVGLALPVYFLFFFVGSLTLCLLEIRQANVPAFTSLVATLEEKD